MKKPDSDIIKMHVLFLEKIEILKEDERKYFMKTLAQLSPPSGLAGNGEVMDFRNLYEFKEMQDKR